MTQQVTEVSYPVYREPAAAGVDPRAILQLIKSWEDRGLGVHAFQISRHGAVIAEGAYAPYSLDSRHMLFSLSKSFTSTAIGFAVQEGKLSVEDKLLSFYPDLLPAGPCENMEKVSLKHLLTMNTGHAEEPDIFSPEPNWAFKFLTSYIAHEPGSHFLYNTAATYMLSDVLTRVTGERLTQYLRPRLFEPLGFESDPWSEISPDGSETGGFGLNMSVRDIGRFAKFVLDGGQWEGKQLLSAEWFREASHPWSDNSGGLSPEEGSDWNQGYGYQFWRCKPAGAYRGDGACGQFAIMLPDQDMSIAITSGLHDMQGVMTAIWEELLPGVGDEVKEPNDDLMQAQKELEKKLESLGLWTPAPPHAGGSLEAFLADVPLDRVLDLSWNTRGVRQIRFSRDTIELMLDDAPAWSQLPLNAPGFTEVWLDGGDDLYMTEADGTKAKRRNHSGDSRLAHEAAVKVQALRDEEGRNLLLVDIALLHAPTLDRWLICPVSGGLVIEMLPLVAFDQKRQLLLALET